jgi:hypothetical protein
MADYKILCPACTSILSSKKPIPNGKKITCPHCQKPFVAATAEVGPAPGSGSSAEFEFAAPAPATSGSPPRHDPPQSTEKPQKSIGKPKAKSGSRGLILWTVIIGLAMLLGAGSIAIYFFYIKPATETPVVHKGKSKKTEAKGEDKGDAKAVAQAPNKAKNAALRKDEKAAKGQEKETNPKAEKSNDAKSDGVKPAVATAPAKPKAPEWKEYKSAKGGYAVEFPAKPDEHLSRDADVIHYETKVDLGGTDYDVTFYRLKKDELGMPVKDRLNGIAEQFKEQTKEKKEIMVNGQPALELQMLLGDMKVLAFQRWLVYKEHVFNISVSGDKERLGPDEVTRFLESFRFVADPQGEFVDLTKSSGIPEEKKKK